MTPKIGIKFEQSERLYDRACKVIPSGVTSSFRAFQRPIPLFIDHGMASRLYDVDGNEYIDYALGHGPLILGHCHPEIVAAVQSQVKRGSTFGCQHELEAEVAKRMLNALAWADRVVFSNTGTEAVQVALRLARAATGRARNNGIRMAPLPRRTGGDGDVAVSTLAAERYAVGPIQLVPLSLIS